MQSQVRSSSATPTDITSVSASWARDRGGHNRTSLLTSCCHPLHPINFGDLSPPSFCHSPPQCLINPAFQRGGARLLDDAISTVSTVFRAPNNPRQPASLSGAPSARHRCSHSASHLLSFPKVRRTGISFAQSPLWSRICPIAQAHPLSWWSRRPSPPGGDTPGQRLHL